MNPPNNYRAAVLQAWHRANLAGFSGIACACAALLRMEDKRAERYSVPPFDSVNRNNQTSGRQLTKHGIKEP